MIKLKVVDFSEFPGPRYRKLGPNSGEEFRETVLAPEVKKHGGDIAIDLDGTAGYGSSFLDESFGGLVRSGQATPSQARQILQNIKCEDDPSYVLEIRDYIEDAIKEIENR